MSRDVVASGSREVRKPPRLPGGHPETVTLERPPGLDSDVVHVRCGSDIAESLQLAGIEGGFLEYSDPVCQGPVPAGSDLVGVRAGFLSRYGSTPEAMRARLETEERALGYVWLTKHVVLWFEHDPYDQLILARVLAALGRWGPPRRLELISIDRFPGVERFVGLGQLSPEDLGRLWGTRQPVSRDQLLLGERIWTALKEPSPVALATLAASAECRILPFMGRAVTRFLQELPSTDDGLGCTERLTLRHLAQGEVSAGDLFRHLTMVTDPLPFLGDAMYWTVLEELLGADAPPLRLAPETAGRDWRHRRLRLTETGREVLAGRDWMTCGPRERWVGGVRVATDAPAWRWDPDAGRPALHPLP